MKGAVIGMNKKQVIIAIVVAVVAGIIGGGLVKLLKIESNLALDVIIPAAVIAVAMLATFAVYRMKQSK
jgi:hypothetical protein